MAINVLLALMVILSFLIAIPLHEFGHALMASWLGDKTPRSEGRMSLSWRTHLDPLGTIMCVVMAFQPGLAVGLGWGKPVKPDPWKLRVGPNIGLLIVAVAGPIFSLLIGLLVALLIRFLPLVLFATPFTFRILQFMVVFASVNIGLTLLNIIPLYPLDGYQILYTLLPSRQAVQFAKSAAYGPLLILALFFLLPFLAQLSGLGNFPLFQLPTYFLLWTLNIINAVTGPLPIPVQNIYLF